MFNENVKSETTVTQQESLMRLFAVCHFNMFSSLFIQLYS